MLPNEAVSLPAQRGDLSVLHGDLQAEYFKLVDIVAAFDQRLLTIKGWGVTLSLATLGLGFQQDHYGLFLVAAASGLAFWLLEGLVKLQQFQYYPRMGDIEVASFELFGAETPTKPVSSPLIDWAWHTGEPRVKGGELKGDPQVPRRWKESNPKRMRPYRDPAVMLPHLVSVVLGVTLFSLGLFGAFGPI